MFAGSLSADSLEAGSVGAEKKESEGAFYTFTAKDLEQALPSGHELRKLQLDAILLLQVIVVLERICRILSLIGTSLGLLYYYYYYRLMTAFDETAGALALKTT
jgi:hypothetical protein